MRISEDRSAESGRAFRKWRAAKTKSEGDKSLVRLWELCEPEIRLALKAVATKEPSVKAWLDRRGLTFEEVTHEVFPAVMDAASRYASEHPSGASFPTFAMKFIRAEVAHIGLNSSPLAGTEELEGQAEEERHPEEESLNFADLVALVRQHRKSEIREEVYQVTRNADAYSSSCLRQLAYRLEEEHGEELERDAKLGALHGNLRVMAMRADHLAGKTVPISRLVSILAERQARRSQGMPPETYSARAITALRRQAERQDPDEMAQAMRPAGHHRRKLDARAAGERYTVAARAEVQGFLS